MPIKIPFSIEFLTTVADQFHSTFSVSLSGMSVKTVRIGKRLLANAAQDGNIVLYSFMVRQSILAHEGLLSRALFTKETLPLLAAVSWAVLCHGFYG